MGPGRPFEKGNKSGKGRPAGSRNKRAIFQEVLEVDGEAIIEKIKGQALKANATAMRLCMERLLPGGASLERAILDAARGDDGEFERGDCGGGGGGGGWAAEPAGRRGGGEDRGEPEAQH